MDYLPLENKDVMKDLLFAIRDKGKKIGIALGSGGARGIAHIGVLEVFEEYGIPIDFIAGTSIGAVVGALYAAGVPLKEIKNFSLSLDKKRTMALFDPALNFSGMFSGRKIVSLLRDLGLKGLSFSDLKIPFSAVATDMYSGRKVVINKGSVVMAVRASSSIPMVFAPVIYKDYYLVDGGVVDPVPVSVVKEMGADIVVAVRLSDYRDREPITIEIEEEEDEEREGLLTRIRRLEKLREGKIDLRIPVHRRKEKPMRFTDIVAIASDIMGRIVEEKSIEDADLVISPYKDDLHGERIKTFEFYRASEAIEKGRKATLNSIKDFYKNVNKILFD